MTEDEFRDTLPAAADCQRCRKKVEPVCWSVSPDADDEWIAVGIAKCEECGSMKFAAAGSSDRAYEIAQGVRSRLLRLVGK